MINSSDPDVNSAIDFFNVSITDLTNQWNNLVPVQPLAWSDALSLAAATHSELMIDFDQQSHQLPGEPGLGQRIQDAGYSNLGSVGENVYAFANSIFDGHAAFAIDWGNTPNGIQNPPGHRDNMMSSTFREVGIGVVPENDSLSSVGP